MDEKNEKNENEQSSQPEGDRTERTTVDEPVLDGATEHANADVDPRKGLTDPALIRDVEADKKTANPYG